MNGQYKDGDIVLNTWKLVRSIGKGSYGEVFEAVREDFDGTSYSSAIKIITIPQSEDELKRARAEGMDDKSVTAYFHGVVAEVVQEVVLMSNLIGNSNIVSYADHVVIEHQNHVGWDIIIRMELLTSLVDYFQKRKLTRNGVIRLGIDLCKALELCQERKIIHRDIKPENIFRSKSGNYKLGDFGIARTVDETTGGLSKKGTYTYMAPEVYLGKPYNSSVDIYSLGIVMYELLNENRVPFLPPFPDAIKHSDRERSLTRRMSGEQLTPPENADAKLAEIVLKACAYYPQDRYSDPAQMRRELELLYDPNEKDDHERTLTKGVFGKRDTAKSNDELSGYPPPSPKGSLIIQMRSKQTNEVLPGAEFRITAVGGAVGLDNATGTAAFTQSGVFTTDSMGEIRISDLPAGNYTVTQIKAPAGYVMDAPSASVEIDANGGTQSLIVTNTPMALATSTDKGRGTGIKALIGILACTAVLVCAAVFCMLVLPQWMDNDPPSSDSLPTDTSAPSYSADPSTPESTPSASPEPTPSASPEPSPWVCPFNDVSEKDWFYDAVKFATERGMISGTGSGKFDPHGIATRGVFVTLLYRFAGSPAAEGSYFDDVKDGQYYTDAVVWAAANGYVSGSGNNLFRPEGQITHQEVIVILWYYAGKPDADATVLTSFPDADQVNSWAVPAMAWAVDVGIIAHTDSRLNPKGDTTRAEAVTYIMRLDEVI